MFAIKMLGKKLLPFIFRSVCHLNAINFAKVRQIPALGILRKFHRKSSFVKVDQFMHQGKLWQNILTFLEGLCLFSSVKNLFSITVFFSISSFVYLFLFSLREDWKCLLSGWGIEQIALVGKGSRQPSRTGCS